MASSIFQKVLFFNRAEFQEKSGTPAMAASGILGSIEVKWIIGLRWIKKIFVTEAVLRKYSSK